MYQGTYGNDLSKMNEGGKRYQKWKCLCNLFTTNVSISPVMIVGNI